MAVDDATKPKGFAGLQSMVSHVETEVPARDDQRRLEHLGDTQDGTSTAIPQPSHASTEPSSAHVAASGPPGVGSSAGVGKAWAWIIGIVLVLIWLANVANQESKAPTPTSASAPVLPPGPSAEGDAGERRPAAGDGLVLSVPEIRYCLSEKIRIDGMREHVNEYSQNSINLFNQAVSDYNSRCAHFRYRGGTLESVRSEIDPRRAALEREGMERMRGAAPEGTRLSTAPAQGSAGSLATPHSQQSKGQAQRPQLAASHREQSTPPMEDLTPNPPPLTTRTSSGKTYHMANIWDAVRVGSPADVTAMLTDRQDVNLRESGTTLLIEATRMSNYATMEFLLQSGADPDSRNGNSRSALDFARDRNDNTAISILRRFGAK